MLDKNSPYLNSAIINKGRNAGIKLGMPVLSKGNLAGRVVEVNFISSRILLLNDLNSRIPVVISPNGEQAILIRNWKTKSCCRISTRKTLQMKIVQFIHLEKMEFYFQEFLLEKL